MCFAHSTGGLELQGGLGVFSIAQVQTSSTAPELGAVYDKDGNVVSDTDAAGNSITTYTYDHLNRVIQTWQGPVANSPDPGSSTTWTFNNLSPNAAQSYAVYVCLFSTPPSGWQNDYWRLGWSGTDRAPWHCWAPDGMNSARFSSPRGRR